MRTVLSKLTISASLPYGPREVGSDAKPVLGKAVKSVCKSLKGNDMQKITPFLWFDDNAEEAANFYTSLFKNSKILDVARYGEAGAQASGRPKGTVMTVTFQLEGQEFVALNGGPVFTFSPAISLVVNCRTQEELDDLWEKLSEGGESRPVRLAERQIWRVLADRSPSARQDAARQGPREVGEGHGGNAPDEEDRHGHPEAGL